MKITLHITADEFITMLNALNSLHPPTPRRRGGPVPTHPDVKLAAITGWLEAQGKESQEAYCARIGISPRTLRRWIKELEDAT